VTVAGVLLAAGEGQRYSASGGRGHKLLAEVGGRTVVGRAIDQAARAGLDVLYVVVGSVEVPVPADVQLVRNPRWADGMATSLQAGIAQAGRDGHDAVVVGLGDQPLVEPEAWRRVAGVSAPIVVATYAGVRGHPVRLEASVWPLLPTEGDRGARRIFQVHPELVTEVPCPGSLAADVDTVADLRRLTDSLG
jgi:molybdenum cofactor cytidylyltransferase